MTTPLWLWQQADWPHFTWQESTVQPKLRAVHHRLGLLSGKASLVAADEIFSLDALLANIVASSAIESEKLDIYSVRSSLARQLGINIDSPVAVSDKSFGVASLMKDAVTEWRQPLTLNTLLQWHYWLFQGQTSLMHQIEGGTLRGEATMQIVSGPIDKPKVHYQAPARGHIDAELKLFIHWFNQSLQDPLLDPIARAAITHLWFITLHPFEDGNGRITRALTDRALAQADQQSIRLYAMSEAILKQRSQYYEVLEATQKGGLDITLWISWFCDALLEALADALNKIERTLLKAKFWQQHSDKPLLEPQRKVLNRLLDGDFALGINATQYQRVAKVSKATATRHLTALIELNVLIKLPGGGRSTRYAIAE
ncbi:Fic family protein [Oceanisphaera sp. IT1-181]|uniref:Fic family protein n=1 Tax=Oceanisphaera sp. IT1-181 TaxID=3081199 RepID=UPI0029CA8E5B|nr:Fic family protein [Oceanisphaera sp. IT1-181]